MLVALDGTVLLVAQPSLQRELGASVAQIQWTSTAYLVAVASLLVVAGRLGDRYGHGRLLVVGVLGFGAASAGIALTQSIGWVIGLRAAQGVCGALLQPATLALLRLAYPAERLSTAVAIRTSAIGVAAGAGPILGGILVAQAGWRAVFWINVPVAALITLVAVSTLLSRGASLSPFSLRALSIRPSTPAPGHSAAARLDLVGAALLTAVLAVTVHTLAGVPEHGMTGTATVLGGLGAAGLAVALVAHESRTAQPIVPRAVARSVPVTASMGMLLLAGAGLFGALFTATFQLQHVLHVDPLEAGLRVLPLTVLMVIGAPVASAALRRYGARACAVTGTALVALGIAGLSRIGPGSTWTLLGADFAVLGAGFAVVMVTATGTVVGDAPAGYAGVVGGLKQTAMNVGPTLGIAIAAGTAGTAGAAGTAGGAAGVADTAGAAAAAG
ncbi:MFS transporter, partial [Streptomyces boluensis]